MKYILELLSSTMGDRGYWGHRMAESRPFTPSPHQISRCTVSGTLGKALNKSDKDPPGANKQIVSIIQDSSAVIGVGTHTEQSGCLPWGETRVRNSSDISTVYWAELGVRPDGDKHTAWVKAGWGRAGNSDRSVAESRMLSKWLGRTGQSAARVPPSVV